MKKRWIGLGALLVVIGFSTLSFLSFEDPPTVLGDFQPPPFGPFPCPNDPLSKIVKATWADPANRHRLLAKEVERRVEFKRENRRSWDPNDVWKWRLPNGMFPGLVLSDEATRRIGETPNIREFRSEMKRLGLECQDRNHAASSEVPFPTTDVFCLRRLPAGCPSHYGHWPAFPVSQHIWASASYREGERTVSQAGYASSQMLW